MDTRPVFGEVREVDKFEFVDEVDALGSDGDTLHSTLVVVHLYEDFCAACRGLNGCLERLARKHARGVCFLRLRALHAQEDFDHVALPALQLYRGGECVCSLVRLTDEIGEHFDDDDVEALIELHTGSLVHGTAKCSPGATPEQS